MILLKKHAFTLLEVMISLSLLSILLVTVLGIYRYVDYTQKKVAIEEQNNFKLLYAQHRLSEVIPKAVSKTKGKEDYYFFTQKNPEGLTHLIFVYDNGADASPIFSGPVIGKLYLEPNGELYLATWPLISREPSNPPMRKELLLNGVSQIQYKFYMPPLSEKKQNESQSSSSNKVSNIWVSEWPIDHSQEELNTLPALVKIFIKIKNEDLTFAFVITHTENHIVMQGDL